MPNLSAHRAGCAPARIAWKVSHSETKPLSGGSADSPAAPMSNATAVTGMRWMSAPSFSMSRRPVALNTAPAPQNSRLFSSAWLTQWKSAAVSASAASTGRWSARNSSARPRPMAMMPMFSTVE